MRFRSFAPEGIVGVTVVHVNEKPFEIRGNLCRIRSRKNSYLSLI